MAGVKKKGAKKKVAKPDSAKPVNGAKPANGNIGASMQVVTMGALVEGVEKAFDGAQGMIDDIGPAVIFPQTLLHFGHLLGRLEKRVEATKKLFEARAKAHFEGKGAFEHGRIAITFPETERCYPKWKEEAIEGAEKLAGVLNEAFDEKTFIDGILDKYPATISQKMKLTVSE